MTSTSSFQNPSLCVYIGNISSFDDQLLTNYCSQFGTVLSCTIANCPRDKRSFCDFRIIEFATRDQVEKFLHVSIHQIGSIILNVKFYEDLLDNCELLNIDRKLFIGPILNSNNINTIVQFYKIIDPTLQYCLSRQDKQAYILIEFSNRQYIRTIIQQKTIPKTIDNQIFTIHTAVNPKELINKKISTNNSRHQICINGLTDQITETILTDYFDKRAEVVACHMTSTDPKCAIIEFENEKCVKKLLDTPIIRLYGTSLSLSKVTSQPRPVLSSSTIDNEEIDELLETTGSKLVLHPPPIRNESFLPISLPIQQQSNSALNLLPHPINTESIYVPAPEISECGWTSPPRTVINHCPPVDQPPVRLSSIPCATTTNTDTDLTYQSMIIDTDTKPMTNIRNNILNFIEQYQNEIDQIKDEYMKKFTKDRTSIEHEINRLINDERITFDKFDRYLYDHRRRSKNSHDNKRKHSRSSSNH